MVNVLGTGTETSLNHLCPGLHANAKIANFAKNRKWCKEDKSPTRTRDFCENCEKSQFSQKSLKSQESRLFSGTCVLYLSSVVRCLRF